MIVTLKIPDEVYEAYVEINRTNPHRAMEDILKRFKGVPPEERVLVFSKEQRQRLEKLLQRPIEDMDKFISLVEGLLSISADGVEVVLSEGQRKRMQAEAAFYKREYVEYMQTRLSDILKREVGP